MKILLAILLAVFVGTVSAETRNWTESEKLWGATAGVLLLGDWATTNNMTHRYKEGYYEHNPLLGPHPTANQVNLHFLIAVPAVYLLADQVPNYRTEILQVTSMVELIAVGNNLRLGLRFQF